MEGLQEFLSMGGYAAFVWPCFGATIAVLGGLFVMSKQRLARLQSEVASLQALQSKKSGRAAPRESN